jgi:protein arginine kinase activator
MKCDHCEREATVHEVTVRNGVKLERHMCEQCAANQGVVVQSPAISDLIKHFVGPPQGLVPVVPPAAQPQRAAACPHCKTTFSEFKQHGLLGCAECYSAFEGQLMPLLERAQSGGQQHVGKAPKRMGQHDGEASGEPVRLTLEERSQRMRTLRGELEQAVKDERYELAATLRDAIKQLEMGA